MNANRARPVAAYILVSLVCAAVMVEGMRSNSLGEVIGASPDTETAAPASNTSTPVPGTVLRSRAASGATAIPAGLPQIGRPSATPAGTVPNTASGTGSSAADPSTSGPSTGGSSTGGSSTGGSSSGGPGPSRPSGGSGSQTPDGPTVGAGGVATERPGAAPGKKGKATGKQNGNPGKKPRAQVPGDEQSTYPSGGSKPGQGKSPGKGKA